MQMLRAKRSTTKLRSSNTFVLAVCKLRNQFRNFSADARHSILFFSSMQSLCSNFMSLNSS